MPPLEAPITQIPPPGRRSFREVMTEPVVGPLLQSRFCAVGCSIIGIWQVASALVNVTVWECPVPRFLAIPCPGCGLSRASGALFRGQFNEVLHYHAFAPFFMIALAAFIVAAILPTRSRDWFAGTVTAIERRLPLAPSLLLLLMVYWLARVFGGVIQSH